MSGIADRYLVMPSNCFLVEIENVKVGFSRISNVQSAVEYDTFAEGGLNGYVHTLVKPATQAQTLTLEKGISLSGWDALKSLKLAPGRMLKMPIEIRVRANKPAGQDRGLEKRFRVSNCMVVKWELGQLDAMSSEVLVERFEVAHGGIVELDPGEA